MLDSDYLEDGKHKSVRDTLTIMTLFVISTSLAYFACVIYYEIVAELFPALKCTCFDGPAKPAEHRDSSFDVKNIELAEGNFNRRADKRDASEDSTLMSVEEQLQMKQLLAKMQDENRALKKDLASKADAKKAEAKVVKKKKGFGIFSPAKPTNRGSALVDASDLGSFNAEDATPTSANPMFRAPTPRTPGLVKAASKAASPKPPPTPKAEP